MLSRSDSWGWSMDGVHRWCRSRGAVWERPDCERVLGVTSPRAGSEVWWASPWPGVCGTFDLTDAGGEVRLDACKGGDMETTLVNPLGGLGNGSVAACVVGDGRGGQQGGRTAVDGRAGGVPRRLDA